ncbi:MAG: hypothetical protein KatS3mg104_3008 [Phycisphaerae bacterium]|jgi:hypothetical protein|nr:MAG: hypothetical protein KatS3mg104_3008 [Phycisphaerae bacterium]
MIRRLAASFSLVVFAMCLIEGLRAENPFTTVVGRALLGLVVTFGVGLILGGMVDKMLKENLEQTEKSEKTSNETPVSGR